MNFSLSGRSSLNTYQGLAIAPFLLLSYASIVAHSAPHYLLPDRLLLNAFPLTQPYKLTSLVALKEEGLR